jgi:GDP-4-dehydro-6-deoxy-D-mannose reductase
VAGLPLITGATGFAGSHLRQHLMQSAPSVAAWSGPRSASIVVRDSRVQWSAIDLRDRPSVVAAIGELRPSVIYHCAGAADVGGSWADPVTPLEVNTLSTHHLLDAVRRAGLSCPVVVAGSAAIYRASADPLAEDSPIGPSSPYGLSKLAQEMVASRATWSPVFLARPFNHAGPRQSPAYVTSSFARQIAEIEAGLAAPALEVGNLDARRDITDVRDTVRAYAMLVERGVPGRPYNICCGRAYRIADLLETLLGFARARITVRVDPARLRPSDNPVVVGDPSRITSEVGWRAAIPIDETLKDLLDYWRQRIAVAQS